MSFIEQSTYIITTTQSHSKLKRFLYSLSLQLKDSDVSMDSSQAKELSLTLLDLLHRTPQQGSTTSMSESEVSSENKKHSLSSLALRCLLHLTRRHADSLFADSLALLGDLPTRPGLLTVARSPRNYGQTEAAFALQAAVALLRAKAVKTSLISLPSVTSSHHGGQASLAASGATINTSSGASVSTVKTHGFMSSQEVTLWTLTEIITLVTCSLHASFEPPSPSNVDLSSAAIAVVAELAVNTPWSKLPALLATQLTLAIDRNLNTLANSAAQLPLLQALTLVIPYGEIKKISEPLIGKFAACQNPTPALFEALGVLLKSLTRVGCAGNFLPLVFKGLEPGGILITAVRCAGILAVLQREAAVVLLERLLEISPLVEDGPLKAEIVEATASCFFTNSDGVGVSAAQVTALVEHGGKSSSAKLRAAAGRACGEVVVTLIGNSDKAVAGLVNLWGNLLEDSSVEVVNGSLRGLMLIVSHSETSASSRNFLIHAFRTKVRDLAQEIAGDEDTAMRRERIRADAVRAMGIFGDFELLDQDLVICALESKIIPTVQAAVWSVEKNAVVFASSDRVQGILVEVARNIKDETNARRVIQCIRAIVSHRFDPALDEAMEGLIRRFPSAKK
jgi:hypothetical protein